VPLSLSSNRILGFVGAAVSGSIGLATHQRPDHNVVRYRARPAVSASRTSPQPPGSAYHLPWYEAGLNHGATAPVAGRSTHRLLSHGSQCRSTSTRAGPRLLSADLPALMRITDHVFLADALTLVDGIAAPISAKPRQSLWPAV